MAGKSSKRQAEGKAIPLAAGSIKVQIDNGSFAEVPGEVMLAVQSGRGELVGLLINRVAGGYQLPAEQLQGILVILRSLIDLNEEAQRREQAREELREELEEAQETWSEAERLAKLARARRDEITSQLCARQAKAAEEEPEVLRDSFGRILKGGGR